MSGKSGNFNGHNTRIGSFADLAVTESVFEYRMIDWHAHENPYFSLVLSGNCLESNRRETFHCTANTALFHNARQYHYNIKSGAASSSFQVELELEWCRKFEIDLDALPATAQLDHPGVRLLLHNIYKEACVFEPAARLTVDALLIEAFALLRRRESAHPAARPQWARRLQELLREESDEPRSLMELSEELGVHWAHLSRDFPRYFHCNFSQYIRKSRVERALGLLRKRSVPLADIACRCGFADQSHFIRCFKQYTGITPKAFRDLVS